MWKLLMYLYPFSIWWTPNVYYYTSESGGYGECAVHEGIEDDTNYCNKAEVQVTMTSDSAFIDASHQSVIECDPTDGIENSQVSYLNCYNAHQCCIWLHHSLCLDILMMKINWFTLHTGRAVIDK